MSRAKGDGVTATVSINGKVLGNLNDLVKQPTQEFKDAFRGLAERAMGYVEPQPAVIPATQLGFDYSLIDEGIRDEVRSAARSIHQLGKGIGTGLIAIGKRLVEVKGMMPHGQFTAWIEGEFGLSERVAQNYMNVAREFGGGQNRIDCSVFNPSVLYLLAAPSTPPEVREIVEVQFAATGKPPTHAEVKRLRDERKPAPNPPPSKVVYVEPTPKPAPKPSTIERINRDLDAYDAEARREHAQLLSEPTPVTPPDLAAAGYTIVRDGDAWGWLRESNGKPDGYGQHPAGEFISTFPGGNPFGSRAQAIEEARRDLVKMLKYGPTSDYYPVKHGLGVNPADLVVAGYELVGGDGDAPADGKRGYRWKFGDEMGPNVAYAGAAIEGARAHLAATSAPGPDPVVIGLCNLELAHLDPMLKRATVDQLEAALKTIPYTQVTRINRIEERIRALGEPIIVEPDADDLAQEADDLAAMGTDPDEAEAIALVVAETAQEDAERAARDAARPSFERVPEQVAAPATDNPFRQERAIALRAALINARDLARQYYGDLTGRHTDMLEFERGVADMLPPLESLIAILEGTK